ncbi:NAD(P)/FAD-dependent oxidoreductase [Thauera aromatica]|uniref:flavin monoamine oxidase family protein n=1 Tax=Thauera aromatica TaxID=59405 RepID=UPI001FFDDB60|nr:NAD(P)/FAD-dependent oxidoreductase [Thauera aromatica]MCK2086798.1 NAD(P)/FAD-dependent oxidoreductase [Thauera aromatica]
MNIPPPRSRGAGDPAAPAATATPPELGVGTPDPSRRRFFKTAAVTAAATALPLSAHAATSAPRSAPGDARYDVAVIGGGFAGVTAARELAQRGAKVVLLEARNRLGGRTFYSNFGDKKVELGGTWIHYSQPHVWAEVMRYGMEIAESPGVAHPERVLWMSAGKVLEIPVMENWALLEDALKRFHADTGKVFARPFVPGLSAAGRALDHLSIADRMAQIEMSPAQRDLMNAMMATNCHGRIDTAAYTEMLRWWSLVDGDAARLLYSCARYKLEDGTAALIERMVEDGGFETRLATAVAEVKQSATGVTLVTEEDARIDARYAVLSVPVNTTGMIEFSPPLRAAKQAMAKEHHAGKGHKLYLKVRGRLETLLFFAPETELFTMVFTEQAGEEGGVLVAFGPPAGGKIDLNDPKAVEPFIRRFLPHLTVEQVLGYDWALDPYSQGTWCTYRPKQFGAYLDDLRAREGRLFFAGADIATGWRGFIDGAIESGLQVGQAVAAELRREGRGRSA